MATAPIRTDPRRAGPDIVDRAPTRRESRLAELVAGLCDCEDDDALDAVRSEDGSEDPLEVVARAVTGLRHRPVEPQDRFRVAGFLRTADRLPRRSGAAGSRTDPDRLAGHLVHHASLRRWERIGADEGPAVVDDPGGDDQVIDLRDGTARFRRPLHGR